jgi:histidinol-phosphatase (PHP family)
MKYACLHTHTNLCDGKADVESFCQKAWEKGLCALGFSSHAPVVKKTGFAQTSWNMREELLDEYIETVNSAKRRWEGRLAVYLGLEVDFIPGLMGPADRDYGEMGLDYIIGSVHFVLPPKGAPFTVDAPLEEVEQGIREGYCGDPLAMVEAYWDSLEAMIRSGGFDILGHVDVIKKNNSQNRLFSEDRDAYRKKCAAIAALSGEKSLTIEVNTGGMNRGRIDTPYPSLYLLQCFRKNNVPAMINADAHNPGDLTGHYKEAIEALLAAGYTQTVLFEGRKNGLPVWTEEKLGPEA